MVVDEVASIVTAHSVRIYAQRSNLGVFVREEWRGVIGDSNH
jgi:hypothetical protein